MKPVTGVQWLASVTHHTRSQPPGDSGARPFRAFFVFRFDLP